MTRKTTQQLLDEAVYAWDNSSKFKNPFQGWRTMIENLFLIVSRHERELAKMRKASE